jgi:hypothetical protein
MMRCSNKRQNVFEKPRDSCMHSKGLASSWWKCLELKPHNRDCEMPLTDAVIGDLRSSGHKEFRTRLGT